MKKPELTVAIVDDEQAARYGLRTYVNKTPSLRCVGEFQDVMTFDSYLRKNSVPDIIFMDIRMPEVSGLQFIASATVDSAFIIVTAYEQFALDGFDLNVCDYLLKPVSYRRFVQAVEKTSKYVYFRKGLVDEDFIFLRSDRIIHRIRISDIEYVESMENYVKILTPEGKIITRSTLRELIDSLSPKGILQIHKSFAVNVVRIKRIERKKIITEGGYVLPFSRTYKDSLQKLIPES